MNKNLVNYKLYQNRIIFQVLSFYGKSQSQIIFKSYVFYLHNFEYFLNLKQVKELFFQCSSYKSKKEYKFFFIIFFKKTDVFVPQLTHRGGI